MLCRAHCQPQALLTFIIFRFYSCNISGDFQSGKGIQLPQQEGTNRQNGRGRSAAPWKWKYEEQSDVSPCPASGTVRELGVSLGLSGSSHRVQLLALGSVIACEHHSQWKELTEELLLREKHTCVVLAWAGHLSPGMTI